MTYSIPTVEAFQLQALLAVRYSFAEIQLL